MSVGLTWETRDDGGAFRYGDAYDAAVDAMDDVLSQRELERLGLARCVARLKSLVERHPDFIDGHAHLGFALLEQDKPKLALEACLRGLTAGERVMPSGYQGRLEWPELDNRPFLRAAHGAVLCYMRLGDQRKAAALMERMLAWNPNDNQGIRYLIGSAYLRLNDLDKARRVFEREAADYPPYWYEAGLLDFKQGDAVAAATSLRRGFVANPYIAEVLCGDGDPAPLAIWHGTNFEEPEFAKTYVAQFGELWFRPLDAVAFLRWLYTHPKVLAERGGVLEFREALLWEHDFHARGRLLAAEAAAVSRIDDRLSREIVKERRDRDGRPVFPWLYRGQF